MTLPLARSRTLHRMVRCLAASQERSVRAGLAPWYPDRMPTRLRRILLHWAAGSVAVFPLRAAVGVLLVSMLFANGQEHLYRGVRDAAIWIGTSAGEALRHTREAPSDSGHSAALALAGVGMLVLLVVFMAPIYQILVAAEQRSELSRDRSPLVWLERRNRAPLMLIKHAAVCGRALQANGLRRTALMEQARATRSVEYAIRLARYAPGVFGSPRPKRLQRGVNRHAGQVVAAVRAAAARIDADPDTGLREFGAMLLTIAERCAQGRVGAMLDQDTLTGHEPVRSYEALRTLAVAACVAGAAVGGALLHLPTAVIGPLTSAAGVIAVTLLYRRAARRGAEALGMLLSGGR